MAHSALQLQLALLGPPEARLGQRALKFPTRKTLALLAYLATEGGEQQREHLAALLWPEATTTRSHASLRNTLGHLQAALRAAGGRADTPYLTVTHGALGLNFQAGTDLDLQTVERAYALARVERSGRSLPPGTASQAFLPAAAAYRGDFLSGFSLGDAPAFDDWADTQREVWRRRMGLVLDRLSEVQYAAGEFANTAESAAAWIRLDALNERAYRRKMRAHFAAGERGQALETYAACRALLAQELQAEPEPDTEALATQIRAQHPTSGATALAPADSTPLAYLEGQFAGRAAEQQVLRESFRRAATGQPQAVTVFGEPGIGKTRLATEFLAWCRTQGAEVLHGRAFESGSRMPFQPLVEALRQRLSPAQGQLDWLAEAVARPLIQLLPELRERYPQPAGAAEAELGQTQLLEPLVRLMQSLAGQAPLVLFLDDLQWADGATLEALHYAARRWRETSAPVLLLMAIRSEMLPADSAHPFASQIGWLAQLERDLPPHHVQLGPLDQAAVLDLVRAVLAPPAADEFAHWVFAETHGQPFYLIETVKDLLERGALHPRRRPQGGWAFEVDDEHNLADAALVPFTVRAVIRARLDRLSPNAFTLLVAAATLEHDLTFERLCAVGGLPEEVALPALDELVSSHLLLEGAETGAGGRYAFANDMVRDVVYTEAGEARRQLFHRRALAVLAASQEPAAVLAHHALAAGQAEAAFRHSLSAGQEALRLSAAQEAREHLEQARDLALQAPPVEAEFRAHIRDLYIQLGQAYERNGQPEQATAIYAELERLAPKPTP